MHLQNLKSVATAQKLSCDPDHAPFFGGGGFFIVGVGLVVVNPLATFKQHSIIHSRNIERDLKFEKRSCDPDHAAFGV